LRRQGLIFPSGGSRQVWKAHLTNVFKFMTVVGRQNCRPQGRISTRGGSRQVWK